MHTHTQTQHKLLPIAAKRWRRRVSITCRGRGSSRGAGVGVGRVSRLLRLWLVWRGCWGQEGSELLLRAEPKRSWASVESMMATSHSQVGPRCSSTYICSQIIIIIITVVVTTNNNNNNNYCTERRNSRYFTIFSLCHELFQTCTLKWPRHNCAEVPTPHVDKTYNFQNLTGRFWNWQEDS